MRRWIGGNCVMTCEAIAVWRIQNRANSKSAVIALTGSITERRKTDMRTKIAFYGEIAGNIWMPTVECTKAFHLELSRIPRTSTTRTYPGIAPRSMEITCLRDGLLHLTNDGDFQSCAITWSNLEVIWSGRDDVSTRRHDPASGAVLLAGDRGDTARC
jgi:hypothetical protein